MSSWYAYYVVAGDLARERQEEAGRERLVRGGSTMAAAGAASMPVRPGRIPVSARRPAGADARRWTLRLARLAVTVSLEGAPGRGTGA